MNRLLLYFSLVLLVALVVLGCGGSSNMTLMPPPPPAAGNSLVTVTMTDTPPAGVTVLSFEITVTGAMLNPGNVQLVTHPQKIEVKRLETESAFLATTNVAAGTYQSITVALANPELTFLNQTGAALGTCPNNKVCEIDSNATGSITLSAAPFPLTIGNNSPTGLQVDVNVANIVTQTLGVDFTAANAISVTQLTTQPTGELGKLDDVKGVVQNLDATNKAFTLHTLSADYAITTDNHTEFDFDGCPARNFSCLVNGQVVDVDANILPGGGFLAKSVDFDDDVEDDEVEGVIYRIDDATHFEMVVLGELRSVNNVNVGNPVVVTLSNPSFHVQTDNLVVPPALKNAFQAATDTSQLVTGQVVQVRVNSSSPGPPIAITTQRVLLESTQFTANVSGAPTPPNFTVGTLPQLFVNAGISTIQVQTSNQTDFDGVSGVSGLAGGNTVSLNGLLFQNGVNPPELIAKKVRKR
jgi:Domain of unknown function (DUF4382)/Domain of unknown function (DUF5666)